MTFEFDSPETTETGNFLRTPGTYHLSITDTNEQPTNAKNELLNGFRVSFSVLHGTTCDPDGNCTERGKQVDILFFNGKLSDKDQGEFAKKKQAAFFLASGLMKQGDLGKHVSINLDDARGRQVIATLELDRDNRFLQLRFADIFHVDDPAVKDIPKDVKAISLLPMELRMIGAKPAPKPAEKEEPKSETKVETPPAAKPKPAAAVNLNDL